jgi:hypothetical protein
MRTIEPRLPLSAPGPPPRLRLTSGLVQPAVTTAVVIINNANFMSYCLGTEHNRHAENEAADQHQRRAGRGIETPEPLPAPRQR